MKINYSLIMHDHVNLDMQAFIIDTKGTPLPVIYISKAKKNGEGKRKRRIKRKNRSSKKKIMRCMLQTDGSQSSVFN